ncbi:MAG: hypothetical protein EU548_10460 [Promethearchaeota archaeon]|nr:MAG: hypothetical protein EU548_10460 [Candidatus Lokiarchaeota archaeon]
MKTWILYDTQFGNGKKLAESLQNYFPADFEVKTGDVKDISPKSVADDKPEVLILGGAIRMFRGAPKSKKWVKQLDKNLKESNHKIHYATGFVTHGLPTEKVQGFAKRFLKKIEKSPMIEKTYEELLTAQVETQEGPIKPEEMEKAKEYTKNFISWIQ